jgi:hypothetical protein
MAAGAEGQHEDRTRVVCHLPLNNAPEEKAFKDIIEYLQAQRRKRLGVEGYTYSVPTAFSGRWWSTQQGVWLGDRIVLLLIDYRVDLTNVKVSLAEEIAQLGQAVRDAYTRRGRPQEEIWVVSFPVTRHS